MPGDFSELSVMACRVATGLLGWSPVAFWSATPVELAQAIEGRWGKAAIQGVPLALSELARLREEMPDG